MTTETTNPISATSRWMAAARARETGRRNRLFYDPLAAELAGPEGFAWLDRTDHPEASEDRRVRRDPHPLFR